MMEISLWVAAFWGVFAFGLYWGVFAFGYWLGQKNTSKLPESFLKRQPHRTNKKEGK